MIPRSLEQFRLAPVYPTHPTNAAGTSFVEANDNALPLRIGVLNALRLAGRVALAQVWSIVNASRPVTTALRSKAPLVIQRAPRALVVVASVPPLSVHVGHIAALLSDPDQTPERSADVQNLFAGFANGHG